MSFDTDGSEELEDIPPFVMSVEGPDPASSSPSQSQTLVTKWRNAIVTSGDEVSLNLSDQDITTLSEQIGELKELTVLTLASNELGTLPSTVGVLKALDELCLDDNQLDGLPESIGDLENLSQLRVNRNEILELPTSFVKLTNLVDLSLQNNQLTVLPADIGKLRQLQTLSIDRNELVALPDSIGELVNLRVLSLVRNDISVLPKTIGKLTNLEEFHLDSNQLSWLPEEIGLLSSLETLMLNDNHLSLLPDSLTSLARLKVLSLDDNLLRAVPPGLAAMPLQTLELRRNLMLNPPDSLLSRSASAEDREDEDEDEDLDDTETKRKPTAVDAQNLTPDEINRSSDITLTLAQSSKLSQYVYSLTCGASSSADELRKHQDLFEFYVGLELTRTAKIEASKQNLRHSGWQRLWQSISASTRLSPFIVDIVVDWYCPSTSPLFRCVLRLHQIRRLPEPISNWLYEEIEYQQMHLDEATYDLKKRESADARHERHRQLDDA